MNIQKCIALLEIIERCLKCVETIAVIIDKSSNIEKHIVDVYPNFAEVFKTSAEMSLKAMKDSKNPIIEIKNAISDFNKAYFSLEKLLSLKRKHSFLSIFTFFEEDVIAHDKKNKLRYEMGELARLNMLLYDYLSETENAKYWEQLSRKCFSEFIQSFFISIEDLEKIDPSFVKYHCETDYSGHPDVPDTVTESYVITKTGLNYIEEQKKEMRQLLDDYLWNSKFVVC